MISRVAFSLLTIVWIAFQPCQAAMAPDLNGGSLEEVWTVDDLPRDVQVLLGRFKVGPDGFADRDEPMNFTDRVNSKVASRRLVLAGANLNYVLVCFEYASGGDVAVVSYRRSGGPWRREDMVAIPFPVPRTLMELLSRLPKRAQ
jgi:hypothetical protein